MQNQRSGIRIWTNYVLKTEREGYSGRGSPGVVSAGRRITGMCMGVRTGDTVYRRIGNVVHADAIVGFDNRQSVDMAGDTGAVYAFDIVVVVMVMGRRREYEEGDGKNPDPTLYDQPIWSHVGEHSTAFNPCQVPSTPYRFRNSFYVFT